MLKKFLIGTLAIAALAFAMTASAADFGSTTLRVGSKGEAVKAVQTLVGATPIDGIFGPMTKAKVMAWQASNGLVADGLFGTNSKAKAANGSVVGGTTLPAECSAGDMFSSTTGGSCAGVVTTLPAGCAAGDAFSSTTGVACTGTVVVNNGALTGGAGTIDAIKTTTDVNSYMVEGQSDVKVLGFKVQANDSDAKVSNVKITLTHTSTGSSYLDRYVGNVSVWVEGAKVATVNAADFTRDSSGVYSKSISLNNAIVRMGTNGKATFYVTVSGISNIDSTDMGATWTILASDFRYQDATGVIMSYTPTTALTAPLSVYTINQTGDVKLVISTESTPATQNVKVSNTSSTSDLLMLSMKAKNTGADMTLDSMSFDLTATTSPVAMIGELTLKANGASIATWSPAVSNTTTALQTIAFSLDSRYTLAKDSTTVFTVVAKINDIDNFGAGELTISYNNATSYEVSSTRTALTETGSATGLKQTFFNTGVTVSNVSGTYSAPVVGSTTTTDGTISISFTVTNIGDSDVTIKEDGSDFTNTVTGATGGAILVTESNNTVTTGSPLAWTISSGAYKTFTLLRKVSSVTGFPQLTVSAVAGTTVTNVKYTAVN